MRLVDQVAPTSTRVPLRSNAELNWRIRAQADARIARLEQASPEEIDARLAELASEWDIERVLQANAGTLMMLGVALGLTVNRRLLLLPTAVLAFFAQHALQGSCPPVPVFRRLGVRTVREIERERYAIKALRGDFDALPESGADTSARVRAVLGAIDR